VFSRRNWGARLTGSFQESRYLLPELEHALIEAWTAVIEVHDEAVATGLDVLQEPLDRPLGGPGDRVSAALVAPSCGLGLEEYADAQDDASIRPSPA
jgi:hypothetical protein